jgi:hypothetical protein
VFDDFHKKHFQQLNMAKCIGTTVSGKKCTRKALKGSRLCKQHQEKSELNLSGRTSVTDHDPQIQQISESNQSFDKPKPMHAREIKQVQNNRGSGCWLLGGPKKIDIVRELTTIEQLMKFERHPHLYCDGFRFSDICSSIQKLGYDKLFYTTDMGFLCSRNDQHVLEKICLTKNSDGKIQLVLDEKIEIGENKTLDEFLGQNIFVVQCSR